MVRYTTPTIRMRVKQFEFPADCDIYVSFEQKPIKLVKRDPVLTIDDEDTIVEVTLTQEETGKFKACEPVEIMINWITPNGYRDNTNIAQVNSYRNLLDR